MLEKNIVGHADQPQIVAEIVERVATMLRESKRQIRFDEYRKVLRLEGQRIETGENTIVITLGGGDPDVDVMVDINCCGGK